MKANRLSSVDDLVKETGKTAEEVEKTLRRVKRTVSLMTGRQFDQEILDVTFLEDGDAVLLAHWPVRKVEPEVDFDPLLGILYPTRTMAERTYLYEVGYRDGEFPALEKELIEKMVIGSLTGDEEIKDFVADSVRVARIEMEREEKERDARKASRARESQGSGWYRQS